MFKNQHPRRARFSAALAGIAISAASLVAPLGAAVPHLPLAQLAGPAVAEAAPALSPAEAIPGFEAHFFDLMNADRAAHGLAPLAHDPALGSIARWRSEDMATRGYFSHDIGGYQVFTVLKEQGVAYRVAGENLAFNTYAPDATVSAAEQALMNSPSHRANILREDYTHAGVGIAVGPDGRYLYTQLFTKQW
jgi:uncharacterized protein YkwD